MTRAESRTAVDAGHATLKGSRSKRFGVAELFRQRRGHRLREKPAVPKTPDRRLVFLRRAPSCHGRSPCPTPASSRYGSLEPFIEPTLLAREYEGNGPTRDRGVPGRRPRWPSRPAGRPARRPGPRPRWVPAAPFEQKIPHLLVRAAPGSSDPSSSKDPARTTGRGSRPGQADVRRTGEPARSSTIRDRRAVHVVHGDIADARPYPAPPEPRDVNFAAEPTSTSRSRLGGFMRTGVIGVHVLPRGTPAETDGPTAGSVPGRLVHVSTDESMAHRRGVRDEETPFEARSPYAAARRGHILAGATTPRRAGRRDHPRKQHLRPVPAPRKADPAVRDERHRRSAPAALRRRVAASGLAPCRGSRRRG